MRPAHRLLPSLPGSRRRQKVVRADEVPALGLFDWVVEQGEDVGFESWHGTGSNVDRVIVGLFVPEEDVLPDHRCARFSSDDRRASNAAKAAPEYLNASSRSRDIDRH